MLIAEPAGFAHCGVDLSAKVEGLQELALEEGFRLHPDDLRDLGWAEGDPVRIQVGTLTVTDRGRPDDECPRGVVYYHRPVAMGGLEHRRLMEPLYRLRQSPVRVHVECVRASEHASPAAEADVRISAAAT
jgi:hypothetical protein